MRSFLAPSQLVDIFAVQQTLHIHTLGCFLTALQFPFCLTYTHCCRLSCALMTQVNGRLLRQARPLRTSSQTCDNKRQWQILSPVWPHACQRKHPGKPIQDKGPAIPASWTLLPTHHQGIECIPISGFPLSGLVGGYHLLAAGRRRMTNFGQ